MLPTQPKPTGPIIERPDRSKSKWGDFPMLPMPPPYRNLPHFQPGMPFPQIPGHQEWDDDLTRV